MSNDSSGFCYKNAGNIFNSDLFIFKEIQMLFISIKNEEHSLPFVAMPCKRRKKKKHQNPQCENKDHTGPVSHSKAGSI